MRDCEARFDVFSAFHVAMSSLLLRRISR